ncbi:hypothetical protein YTPLAS18_37200 [Nitrospira sp.]|nr:hypothetical protein YTPLAS18_37200 [Nitrospira sp.]
MNIFILLLVSVVATSTTVWADEESVEGRFQKRAVLPAGQVVHGDYFAFGPHVEISGTVNGDVYAAGGDVLVDGTVNGDVIVAGAQVTISGTVSQDARVAGGQVTIGGTVGRNLTVGAGTVRLSEGAVIHDNALIGAGEVRLAGSVGQDARIGAGHVIVSNAIGHDLSVAAGDVRLTSKATVGGVLRYWDDTAPSIDEGATVRGGVARRPLPELFKTERIERGVTMMRVLVAAANFVSTLLLGLLLTWIYPVFTFNAGDTIRRRPGAALGVGGIALVAGPFVIGLSLMTVLGIPLGVVLAALYLATLYLARIFAMVWLGLVLLQWVSGVPAVTWAFITGLLTYTILSVIPLVGPLVTLLSLLLGLGALAVTKTELVSALRRQQTV